MKNLIKSASWIVFDFRTLVGMRLLRWALAWMPRSFSLREGIARGIAEQEGYDRYCGYTLLCGAEPWPFDKWREVWRTMRVRAEPKKLPSELMFPVKARA